MSLEWVHDLIRGGLPTYGADAVFRARQGAALPTGDFITYQVINLDTSRGEYLSAQSDLYTDPDPVVDPAPIGTFDRTYQQNCLIQIQIDCYSVSGLEHLRTLQSFCRMSQDAAYLLNAGRASFVGADTIRDLSSLADNEYSNRWSSVFEFNLAMARTESLNAILEWEIAGLADEIETVIIV